MVVESPLDVVRLWCAGVWAVASFGVYISDAQLDLLSRNFTMVVVAVDNPAIDKAGREALEPIMACLRRRGCPAIVFDYTGLVDRDGNVGEGSRRRGRRLLLYQAFRPAWGSVEPIATSRSGPYQESAVDEALCRRSLLLALVQGAGKTRTVIETIRILAEEGSVRGGAIFAPARWKFQWRDAELAKWDSAELAIVIDGSKKKRTQQYQEAHKYRYTILNYDAPVHDWDPIKQYLPIDFIVADEVTFIKGLNAKRSKRLKMLGHYARYRYGLSGQPIENRPEELYSIMQFVDPTVLGDPEHFDRTFLVRTPWGKTVGHRNLPLLRQTLGDAMFRRSRADIAEYLPRRIENDIPVHMTGQQAKLYDYIRDDLCNTIDQAMAGGVSGLTLSRTTAAGQLRQQQAQGPGHGPHHRHALAVLAPSLLSASAQDYDDPNTASGFRPTPPRWTPPGSSTTCPPARRSSTPSWPSSR